jgi:ribonuclease HII
MVSDKIPVLCGLDEAGRGPLAGPVCAGAVILSDDFPLEYLNDSKKLSAKKREYAEKLIKEKCCWGIGIVDHETIDKINILQASLLAMKLAFEMLLLKLPEWAESQKKIITTGEIEGMADGTFSPEIPVPCRCEPKADGTYPPVMAASIIAKTGRDRIMMDYDRLYPLYGYARHKGYPTPEHINICRTLGPSPIQRLSFRY